MRGVTPMAFEMRPYVKIIEGRMFRPGVERSDRGPPHPRPLREHGVGDAFISARRNTTSSASSTRRARPSTPRSGPTPTSSAGAQARRLFVGYGAAGRPRPRIESLKAAIKNDNRLKLAVKTEYQYYDDQTSGLLGIMILVGIVTLFMIIGAILGTMNTMFSAIASRGRELATLRALGFKRRTILLSVVIESAFVSLLGGLAGVLLALPVNGISTGTTNFATFSEVAFSFRVDAAVALTAS